MSQDTSLIDFNAMNQDTSSIDFRLLFETMPGLCIVLWPDLTVAMVTDEYLRATMVRREDLVGHNIFDVFPENPETHSANSAANVRASLEKVFRTGEIDELPIQKYDVQRPAAEGGGFEERYWNLKSFPGVDGTGKVAYVVHRVEDITEIVKLKQQHARHGKINAELKIQAEQSEAEREHMARALEDAQLRLEGALDAGEIGTWMYDIQNDRVFADKSMSKMFSVPPEKADGGANENFLKAIHPEDRQKVEEILSESLVDSDSFEAEYRVMQPDNSVRWVIARGKFVRNELGEAIQLPGVVIDITEREKRRQESEILQVVSRQLVSVKELEDVSRIICQAVRDLLHSDGATFVLHEDDTVHYFDENAIEPLWKGRKFPINCCVSGWSILERQPVAIRDIYVDHRIPHDAYRPTFVNSLAMMPVGPGDPVAAIGAYWADNHLATREEINLLKSLANLADLALANARSYNEMRQARLSAEEANRLKDEFLATISHELRTPLNAILGWSQMYQGQALDNENIERAFETIARNARSQNQLIDDLLDVSRIISGKLRLDVQPLDLTKIIDAALDAIRPAAVAREIGLQTLLGENVGPIYGDPDRLQQIVWNLLSNAIKFTPKGGRVTVRLEKINSHVEITIADTGVGIERDFLPFVFDRFRQADSSSKRQHGGLGLGLAIVRHLTELHGGTVEVFSEGTGRGTAFKISLPRHGMVPQPEERRQPRSDVPEYLIKPPNFSGVKILIVDDDEDTRAILSIVLERGFAEVYTADSVDQAISLLEKEDFTLLISDIEMPHADGYDLIQRVRETSKIKNIPAIAVTAYARVEDRMRVIAAGYNIHIPKPVESQELLTIAASLVKHSRYAE